MVGFDYLVLFGFVLLLDLLLVCCFGGLHLCLLGVCCR